MTASEKSYVGVAKQTGKGTINSTAAEFKYILFNEGTVGVQNVTLPLDREVGGGVMLRDVVKVGVTSGGGFAFIPRPASLGDMLMGALGKVTSEDILDGAYSHVFELDSTDQFSAPYYTVQYAPGDMWGETFMDCRFAGVTLTWRAANYLRGQFALMGGTPVPGVTKTGWTPLTYVDGGPQFLAPKTTIELPTATAIKVLSGAVTMGMEIPLDDQWITGAYSPDDFDITQRAFSVTFVMKVTDSTLYDKVNYDGEGAVTAWATDMFREGDFLLKFESDRNAGTTPTPYSLQIEGNGYSGAANDANVVWSGTPLNLRAGRQVTMAVTGTFLADASGDDAPITVTLVNQVPDTASY